MVSGSSGSSRRKRHIRRSSKVVFVDESFVLVYTISFAQVFGRDLREARDACIRWRRHGDSMELEKAWEIYYQVSNEHKHGLRLNNNAPAIGLQEDREANAATHHVGSAIRLARVVEVSEPPPCSPR